MTLDEFFAALSRTPRTWYLEHGQILCLPRDLAAMAAKAEPGEPLRSCPITVVAESDRPSNQAFDVAIGLGFSEGEAEKLVETSGNRHHPGLADRRALRARLLEACGLEEV